MSAKTEREAANVARREAAAAKQKPLPMAAQLQRSAARREAHERRYPSAPYIDPLSQVSGDPRGRDEPAPRRPAARNLTFADLIYAFDVTGLLALRAARATNTRFKKKAA